MIYFSKYNTSQQLIILSANGGTLTVMKYLNYTLDLGSVFLQNFYCHQVALSWHVSTVHYAILARRRLKGWFPPNLKNTNNSWIYFTVNRMLV